MLRIKFAVLLLLLFTTSLLFSQNSEKALQRIVSRELGIEKIEVRGNIVTSEIIEKIKDLDCKAVKRSLEDSKIDVKKLIFTDQYGIEISFTYTSFFPSFETDIYIDVVNEKAISRDNLMEIALYTSQLREILFAENLYSLDELLSYRATGDKICVDIDPETGFTKKDYSGTLYISDFNITKLKDIKEIESQEGLLSQLKDYFIVKQLNIDPEVKSEIRTILYNDKLTDEKKVQKIKEKLEASGLYSGQIKRELSDSIIVYVYEKEIMRIKDLIDTPIEVYDGVKLPEDVEEILGYYYLKIGLTCLIAKLNWSDIHSVKISMNNSIDTQYDEEEKIQYLNMEDFFFFHPISEFRR